MKITKEQIAAKKELAATGNKGSIFDSGKIKVLTNFNLSGKESKPFIQGRPEFIRKGNRLYPR